MDDDTQSKARRKTEFFDFAVSGLVGIDDRVRFDLFDSCVQNDIDAVSGKLLFGVLADLFGVGVKDMIA